MSDVVGSDMTVMAKAWHGRAATVAHGHYRAALRFSHLKVLLGVPAVALATIVATSVFATLGSTPRIGWNIGVGLMSVGSAVLSALQSFLGYGERAERHRSAGAKYNGLGRELELWLAAGDENVVQIERIRAALDELGQASPHIPESVHKRMAEKADDLRWKL